MDSENHKEKLREEYKLICKFMDYKYIPNNDRLVNENNYIPGWYKKVTLPEELEKGEVFFIVPKKGGPSYITRKTLDLNFRHDWNKLMEVVNKIEKLQHQRYGGFHVHIDSDCCLIQSKNRSKESTYSKMYCGNKDKKKAVYESVLLFLEFWNKNN